MVLTGISNRYRELVADIEDLLAELRSVTSEEFKQAVRQVEKGFEHLEPEREDVGAIPQTRLEKILTPHLMRAHTSLDRGRLLFEEGGEARMGKKIWNLEQQIYRLLNDL